MSFAAAPGYEGRRALNPRTDWFPPTRFPRAAAGQFAHPPSRPHPPKPPRGLPAQPRLRMAQRSGNVGVPTVVRR
jgi:hypothetical protein